MNLNDMFDAVIVLNLDRRTDRLESITHQLDKLNTKFYRWPAIDDLNTDMTPIFCNVMNNRNRLHYAQWKEYKTVLFLDDDCEFVDNFYEKLEQVWQEIPDDWDTISFGDHLISFESITNRIKKIQESYGGHATAIKLSCVPILFEALQGKTFADMELNKASDKLNRYAIEPGLVGQGRYVSDLVGDIRPNNLYNLWQ
jgi:hypothetical protein